jgi:cytochrome P450
MSVIVTERVAACVLLWSIAWPAVTAVGHADFRRAFPAVTRRLGGLTAGYLAAVAAVTAVAPAWVLTSLILAALGALVALKWIGAPTRGSRRGWPQGSLCPMAVGPWVDRTFFSRQRARFGDRFKTTQFWRPMACFVGLADGIEFIGEHESSLASPPMAFGRFIPGGFLRHMAPERHAVAKEAFRGAFDREVYEPLEPFVRDQYRTALARMADASAEYASGTPPRRHVQRAVFGIWARLFFGVEPESDACEELRGLYKIIDIRNPCGASDRAIKNAVERIIAIVRDRATGQLVPGAHRPESFLDALSRHRPGALRDASLVTNLAYVMHTTWADVSGLLVWALRLLTDHPEWVDRLRAEGTDEHQGSTLPLGTRIVLETLRLEQSEYLYRIATRTIRHGDLVVPRGWLVRLCVQESHRDATIFERPDTFDPDRFLRRTYTRREYSPFGAGLRHACLGEGLTKMVGRAFVEELARDYEWATVQDGPPEYSTWRHWRPSSDWRITVKRRA